MYLNNMADNKFEKIICDFIIWETIQAGWNS